MRARRAGPQPDVTVTRGAGRLATGKRLDEALLADRDVKLADVRLEGLGGRDVRAVVDEVAGTSVLHVWEKAMGR